MALILAITHSPLIRVLRTAMVILRPLFLISRTYIVTGSSSISHSLGSGKQEGQSMDITSLSSIKPFSYNYRIRVRICRTWRAIKFGGEKYNGFHCIMIDQQVTQSMASCLKIKLRT